jgi:AcrR family transcriptional regulator
MGQLTPTGRPLQARAQVTRQALLDAALDVLVEKGYAATSTTEVAKRAGVSRGAQLHHFPTKQELLTAAVGHLLSRRVEDFRKALCSLDPGTDVREAAIDVLWQMYQGPCFVAWTELWLAARTDPELREVLLEVDRQFDEETLVAYREVLPPEARADPWLQEIARVFTFVLMDGLALRRLVADRCGSMSTEEVIAALKALSHLVFPAGEVIR